MSALKTMRMWNSEVFSTVEGLRNRLNRDGADKTVGLVPTMGALHHGHLSLVKQAFEQCDIVVVSIFVNPTQFNNPKDLEKYPRMPEKDIELLNSVGNVVVLLPSVAEMYPESFKDIDLDLGALATVMEGEFRPGHFKGVMNVVKRLFDIVSPNKAYFGLKDFQQVAVIRHMINSLELDVELVPCDIIRESSGLASSSRNYRLSEEEKEDAAIIYAALSRAREMAGEYTPKEVCERMLEMIASGGLKPEYFDIVHPDTLMPIDEWMPGANACVAAHCGQVRLIDNLQLVPLD